MRKYLIISLILALALSGMTVVTAQEETSEPQTPALQLAIGGMYKANYLGLTGRYTNLRTWYSNIRIFGGFRREKQVGIPFITWKKISSFLGEATCFLYGARGTGKLTEVPFIGKSTIELAGKAGVGGGVTYSAVDNYFLGIRIGKAKHWGVFISGTTEGEFNIGGLSFFVGTQVVPKYETGKGISLGIPAYMGIELTF